MRRSPPLNKAKRGEIFKAELDRQLDTIADSENDWSADGIYRKARHALTQGLIGGYAQGSIATGLKTSGGVIAAGLTNKLANDLIAKTHIDNESAQNLAKNILSGLAGYAAGGTCGAADATTMGNVSDTNLLFLIFQRN